MVGFVLKIKKSFNHKTYNHNKKLKFNIDYLKIEIISTYSKIQHQTNIQGNKTINM